MENSFVIAQKDILALLASMQPICNKKTPLEATSSILFHITPRELTLKATDLEIALQSTAEIESSSEEVTSFLVAGKRIFELVKELDGDITFTVTESALNVKAAGVDLSLNISSAEDFPAFPERIENMMHLDASFLLSLFSKVAFLIPTNNSNAALNGLLLEIDEKHLSLVTTDGHSLARITTEQYTLPEKHEWLLPKRAVLELKKIVEVSNPEQLFLGTCGNQLVFSGANFNFFTKLIAQSFPAYQPILDREGFLPAQVKRSDFSRTLKRTGCLLAGQFLSASFVFTPGMLDVDLKNKEVGSLRESLSLADYTGEEVAFRFYSPYLLNGLQVLGDEEVQLHIKNSMKPIIFDSTTDQYQFTYLVMPVSQVHST